MVLSLQVLQDRFVANPIPESPPIPMTNRLAAMPAETVG
jgi:hypothetical protein